MENSLTRKSPLSPQVCTLKTQLDPKKFNWIIRQFEKNDIILPQDPTRLADFIEKINIKFKGKTPISQTYLPRFKCKDFSEYFCTIAKNASTNFKSFITPELINSIIESSQYWTKFPEAQFSKEELAVIQLSRICQIHCTTLYKKDIAPESNSIYCRTTITINTITGLYGKVSYIR